MTDWQPMETAPKDRPVLAWCVHEADPYHIEGTNSLTAYGANCEGLGHAADGFNIVQWAEEEVNYGEYGEVEYTIPAWWFVLYSANETPANPVRWSEITEPEL